MNNFEYEVSQLALKLSFSMSLFRNSTPVYAADTLYLKLRAPFDSDSLFSFQITTN